MALRLSIFSLFSFVLGAALFAAVPPVTTFVATDVAMAAMKVQDDRAADRQAIRTHIEKIFRAYADGDCVAIKALHAQNWIGFTGRSRSILHGLNEYMSDNTDCEGRTTNPPGRPAGQLVYKLTEIDFQFYGDVALVPYIADLTGGQQDTVQSKIRSFDVYVKRNGEWNQVGSNVGLHPDIVQARLQQAQQLRTLSPAERQAVLNLRESVWRSYFSNDRALLESVIPEETIAIGAGTEAWDNRAAVLAGAAEFSRTGGKLVRLEFPKTEIQLYGNVAILYSAYQYELEIQGKRSTQSGRATEIFVRRNGSFVNSGWHLDSGK